MTKHDGGFPNGFRESRISLLGIPSERGAGTAGTLMGPAALRTAGLPACLADLGYIVHDKGDMSAPAPVEPAMDPIAAARCRNLADITAWTRAIHDAAYEMARSGGVPVFMGGDHSLSMGTISGVARACRDAGRELAVLWLDAHADYNTPDTTPSGNMHGMALAYLSGDPSLAPLSGDAGHVPIAPDSISLFGVRSVDREERRALAEHGVEVVDMRQIDEEGIVAPLRRILDRLKKRNVHLHVSFDADFLDPALAPGTGTAVMGGATYREAHLVMEMIHDSGLLGSLDLVELNPFLDERGRTARLVADLTASLFGLTVLHRQPA
ncbi:arginase [Chthonobacter rhizosphaerae]|uniref:arginase n=1 Tax=Chthonobacter rhizosphaerae TaxID=2735553 RepID=UPI0015EEF7EA|nr:arginase [Chthonobacter rhizosphaerae]